MAPGKRFWLMKSEPDAFSIDDLKQRGLEPWSGVRNYQARNFMRDQMQPGDLAFLYHVFGRSQQVEEQLGSSILLHSEWTGAGPRILDSCVDGS
jgi:hypothetical protein